ncbi:MAG: dienelactone hydrolase family protein [Cyanobacteria bacterium P01_D01_bin.128]
MIKRILIITVAVCAVLFAATVARGDIVDQSVVYTVNNQPYEGYFIKNEGFGDRQPIVLLIHDWNGIDDYEQRRAQMLAEQGYATFAVDLYGQGVRPATVEESREESNKLYSDRQAMRDRLFAGLATAQTMAGVDPEQVAAIGYCFGGAAALEFARAGADLDGFVSFHGGLGTPDDQDYSQVKGSVLILHGADDPVAPMAEVAALADAMTTANVDYDMEIYGGARHSFTLWGADQDASRYDAQADIKSWRAMLDFFETQLR